MQRLLVAFLFSLVFLGIAQESQAQRIVDVSGYLTAGNTRTFYSRTPNNSNTDTIYRISGNYSISGRLVIQEGAEVHFLPGGRIVDSVGGKIIANGFSGLQRRIQIRGININGNSYEWGHILVLPGADSVFFTNVRFAFFRKKESIDNQLLFGTADAPGNPMLTNSLALMRASNGSGAVICTFSARTWLYDIIVDSCQAIYRGGAFAFMQAPSNSYFPGDDGRFAMVNHQVRKLLIRDTRVFNETATPNSHARWADTGAYGGAIYMSARLGATTSDYRSCFLGYTDSNLYPMGIPANLPKNVDSMQFERCTVNNPAQSQGTLQQQAYGGALYVGDFTGLTTMLIGCNTDSAIAASGDQNMRGGAIYVSKTSSDPIWTAPPSPLNRRPGLAIIKRARFLGNVAGMGGAIFMDWQNNGGTGAAPGNGVQNGSMLNIDGENIVQVSPFVLRDSGNIEFNSNTAYYEGGAIYQNWYTYITGYLEPSTKILPLFDSVEMRVKFANNAAGVAGGSIYLNPNANPDIQSKRVWHIANFVDPSDPRIARPQYYDFVKGGGAEFIGTRDTAYAVEYFRNYVHGGNGGAVYMNMGQTGPGIFAYNRFMCEDKYLASNPAYLNWVNGITLTNGGSGYTSAPSVIITNGANDNTGVGATAVAFVNGGAVTGIFITNPGIGYTQTPIVSIIGGGGIGATATATITNIIPPMPFDKRELTRFIENVATVSVSNDSVALENRTGRGGGLYVDINNSLSPLVLLDTLIMSRVRFEHNEAFTGSAIHSDNYRLQITANQTLVANNLSTSAHSASVDLENPNKNNPGDPNAGATIWADFEGPAPQYESNSRGNAVYDNSARYVLREPDGPHGFGGVDTLRGNFWGETAPDLITQLPTLPIGAIQSTFFIDYYNASCFRNVYEPNQPPNGPYSYVPIGTIPDTLLFEGRIYDIFDKGLDIKTVDYSNRRLAIAEAFSLGLPTDIGFASNNHTGIHRWTRDIFEKDPVYLAKIHQYQAQFIGPHPIGYPLFLTADVDVADRNRDKYARNYTDVIVLNETTNEFVRVNLKEEFTDHTDSASFPYRGRLDFVPDSSTALRTPFNRAKVFWSPTLIRPSNATYFEIARAAKLEDSAALDGRAYKLDPSQLQNSNISGADSIPTIGLGTGLGAPQTLWYAGERYHTLPVRPGDVIAVFSRTQLWKYGFAGAKSRGLEFPIGDVLPPGWAGDVPGLMADTLYPNDLFVHEDNVYVPYSSSQNLNNVMFRIGGWDPNGFYDPRWLWNPYYTMLDYSVTFAGMDSINFRSPWWINRDTVRNVNPGGGSNGYIQLWGTPHNPDVVPGGEPVHVVMTNWPPNKRSEHLLLDSLTTSGPIPPYNNHTAADLGNHPDTLSMWIYPQYFNCPQGFLSDTIDIRRTSSVYDFRIFVKDSLPVFTTNPASGCDGTANLTDSLRFDYDIQTDDETEDSTTAAYTDSVSLALHGDHSLAWDFRYGRTSYSGVVVPLWLKAAIANPKFKTKGIIHVAIDSATAYNMLTPVPQVNTELLLDTIVSVQADDGHSGKTLQQWHAMINVEPKILTTSLPNAKEDSDYSGYAKDTSLLRRIKIFDANFGDTHTFTLLYEGQTDTIYRDERYKTGKQAIKGTTPAWLQINPVSGVLSGVPGVTDAPRAPGLCGGPDTVTVIVMDQCGLTAWAQLMLNVDSTEHQPNFLRGPRTICVQNKTNWCDTIPIHDHDLLRTCGPDSLAFNVRVYNSVTGIALTGWTVTPLFTDGQTQKSDTGMISVCGQFNLDDTYFGKNPPDPIYISVAVDDGHGNFDTLTYHVYVGDIPSFECPVYVSNKAVDTTHPKSDVQRLCFGAGRYGTDSLDIRYCEFEIPSAPNSSVFDARWEYPVGGSLKGGYIDVRQDIDTLVTPITWQIRFNAGSDQGPNGFYYPIHICWRPSCLDNTGNLKGNFYLRHPFTSSEFSINMKTGKGPINNASYTLMSVGNDSLCLEIRNTGLSNALIVYQGPRSGVETSVAPTFSLEPNNPNPFVSSTTIHFGVAEPSNVKLEIYDIKGSLVRTLVNEFINAAGSYPAVWDGLDASGNAVADGAYVCKMTAGAYTSTIKMTLTR
ncbi:MAG TPA: FlgD immunoglobulin-like domain containing protein [Candidatus Kapabacteria bacterium]|nr:FlgD immunoglobulin-like domain containing protein [Candidatus Kapabacteria bacterium]